MRLLAMIMAGGSSEALSVLTAVRSEPSIPFGGKFRIIDFPLSNCVNSEIFKVALLTQYMPRSLNEHVGVGKPWDLDRSQGGVRLLHPYVRRDGISGWQHGTADAIRYNLDYLQEQRPDTVLILAGDHVYKMDYRPMIRFHQERKADVTSLLAQRHALSKSFGIKITSNTFLIRALGLAARQYPGVLGDRGRDGAPVGRSTAINVGFAVNSSQGLVVPVIKDADRKTLDEIASEERILTRHARSNKLTLRDIEGETIALSNLGAYGVDSFLGIPPLPTNVILSAGTPVRTVISRDGCFLARKTMSLSLAADQTAVTGPCAAEFRGERRAGQ